MDTLSFSLAWRWTSENHARFSEEELESIHLLSSADAKSLDLRTRSLISPDGFSLAPHKYDTIAFAGAPEEAARNRLDSLIPSETRRILLSWESSVAIELPSVLFIRRWSDFCYPSSDDVEILPCEGDWLLAYRHWNEFFFGAPLTGRGHS